MDEEFSFSNLVPDLGAGVLDQKLSRQVALAAAATVDLEKVSEVTLTLTFKKNADGSSVVCTHSIKSERPTSKGKIVETDKTATPLFVGPRGALSIIPHRQGNLFPETQEKNHHVD